MTRTRMRRWKSRPPKRTRKFGVFLVVLLLLLIFLLQSFIYVEKHLRAPLMNVAIVRIKQMATEAINTSINERISQGTDFEKLVDWKTDSKGKITGFMLNYAEHMRIAAETVRTVEATLDKLQNRPDYIPLGQALNSAILASFGPDIPIKFVRAGAVKVDLNTRQKDAGINMLLVEVYIRIMAEVTIIIPLETQPELVSTEIPISYLLVVGDVPMYYVDNKGNPIGDSDPLPPTLSLPDAGIPQPDNQSTSQSSGQDGITITN